MIVIGNDWDIVLKNELKSPLIDNIRENLKPEYKKYTIFPPGDCLFRAFKLTAYNEVKVVILGQDPYHQKGQANGLSFSVNQGVPFPPSLINIYKELKDCYNVDNTVEFTGDLSSWAEQGVLMLNSVLTVRSGEAGSHRNVGWEKFTDLVIKKLNERQEPIVFILWGAFAISKKQFINTTKHCVITSPHPSPLSSFRGFFGSKPFIKANAFLEKQNQTNINWLSIIKNSGTALSDDRV